MWLLTLVLEDGQLLDFIKGHKLNPAAVVLTHGHIDHIGGVAGLRDNYPDVRVYIHKLDAKMLKDAHSNLSAVMGRAFSTEPADFSFEDGSIIEPAGIKLQVIHTPGHTPGGMCLYSRNEGIVFTDDTLFAESIGRTDFPGGSYRTVVKKRKGKTFYTA